MEIIYKNENKYAKLIKSEGALLILGGVGYMGLELIWRGRTHWSMGLAGGLCFLSFGHLWDKIKNLKRIYIPIFGSVIITVIELIFGIIFNVILRNGIWDYSNLPFQLLGQVCLLFSTLWGFLSIPLFPLAGKLKSKLS